MLNLGPHLPVGSVHSPENTSVCQPELLKKKVSDCWTETGVSPKLGFICAEMYIQAQKSSLLFESHNAMVS